MNVAEHVERAAHRLRNHPAILFEGRQVSYETLDYCASALADSLARHGVRRGDRVALYLPNIPAFALAYVAILKAGAIAVSINSIFKAEETKFVLNDSGAKVVFTVAELLSNVPREECRSVQHVVLCEGSNRAAQSLDDWLALGEGPRVATEDMQPDDPAALLYSSGTT